MKSFMLLALLSCCVIPLVVGTRFVCYFPNWTNYRQGEGNFSVGHIDPYLCTDLVYSFTILNATTYKMIATDSWFDIDRKGYADFIALKTLNPQLKTTIAIGGWDDSHDGTDKYSKMVADAGNRKIFIDSVVEFLQLYKFDGLDLDWEYPNGDSDKAGFAELLKELRDALGPTKLITVAVGANSTIIDAGYDVAVMKEKADYINLMAYDMHGPWEPQTDHHAPLYKRSWETIDNNIDFIVKYWINKGLPANMINLGIPLYGKSWILGDNSEPKMQALASVGGGPEGPLTKEIGFLGYHEICNSIHVDGWESVDDPEQLNGPYAYSASNPKTWVSYDDTKMAATKSQYVLDLKLGGAMVWDISTDDFHNKCGDGANPLMTTISDTVVTAGSRFICYFPNWATYRDGDGKYGVDNINATLCTDMVYAFAILDNNTYTIKEFDLNVDLGADYRFYAKFVDLKKQNPNLKTTIAIGGWTDSHDETNKYSKMVADAGKRKIFVDSVMEFLQLHKFDGLDIDWEYPASPSDKAGLAELMKELRVEFDKQTPPYLLTIAVGVNLTISDLGYDIPVFAQTADYINIMAYDMHGPWEPQTDHHAPLYKREWDTDKTNNIDAVVRYWVDNGMSPSKLMLGIPLYGKTWTLSYYTEDPTLPAPGLGPGTQGPITAAPGTLGYNEICKYVKTENWEVVVDPEFNIGPYASSPNVPKTWVSYDDPAMAHAKSRYVLDKGLGGAMVWDMSTDDFMNSCGDGRNPIMTNISLTIGVSTSTTTTSKTTAGGPSTTIKTSSGSPTTTIPTPKTTPRSSTTRLSTWPRVTTERTTQVTNSKIPFTPNSGLRIASSSQQLNLLLTFGFILINVLI